MFPGKIGIDAGHGYGDAGAINKERQITEAQINYIIGRLLVARLSLTAEEIYPIWETVIRKNHYLRSRERADYLNKQSLWACLSLHCNWCKDSNVKGWEIWAKTMKDILLAECIGIAYETLPFKKRGIKKVEERLDIVGRTNCPCVLIEMGFISNDKDCDNLLNHSVQLDMAEAIIGGLQNFQKAGRR